MIFFETTNQGSWFTNQILNFGGNHYGQKKGSDINTSQTNFGFMYMLKKNYETLPQDWIISEKSLATLGQTFNAKVITGNATAPPPSEVIPKKL